jgi:antitoxin YefM
MPNRTTYTRARARLASLCDEVAETREPYVIERRDKENVALISEAELESLLETAHLLRSPRNAARLAAALERALGEEPPATSLDELKRELGIGDDESA